MPIDRPRRTLLATLALAGLAAPFARAMASPGTAAAAASEALQALERRNGGRLGVCILDTGTGLRAGHRMDERFPMCSTFKVLLAAHVLARAEHGEERLDRTLPIERERLVSWSPVTGERVGDEMTVDALCEAILSVSDNTATNLLLDASGGPAALTAFARSLGDAVTRLDRMETALNEATPGDPRDTTSPAAMLDSMRAVLLGPALGPASRERLIGWMVASRTGQARLRAGLPPDWRVGDKTGTSNNRTSNDIAIAWPPGRAPVLVTAYYTESELSQAQRDVVLAEVGRIAGSAVAARST